MKHDDHTKMVNAEYSPKEILKFIAVILGIIGVSTVLASLITTLTLENWLRWFMGVFFITFASFKFVGYKMFAMMFSGYDVVAKRLKGYAYIYPFIELGLGALYILDVAPVTRDWLTILILGISSIGVVQELRKRSGIHCACLGNVIKLPLSAVSLVEDVAMVLMAIFMLVAF